MTTNALAHATHDLVAPPQLGVTAAPILVATDGSEASDAAMDAALLLAKATDAPVEVVTAIEAWPSPLAGGELGPSFVEVAEVARIQRLQRVESQVRARLGSVPPPIHVVHGRPAVGVTRIALERHAAMIVVAYGKHGMLQRMLSTETPLRIARAADAPVLCVPPGFVRLPRTVVVTVDLGPECLRAARVARPLLASATQIFLVHAKPVARLDVPPSIASEWEEAYERELERAFAAVAERLALRPDADVTTVVQRGSPARIILDHAGAVHAELLVAGHGHRGRLERLLGGSIASQLFRGAQCALLLAPDAPGMEVLPAANERTMSETVGDRSRWVEELVRFTERNVGRTAMLELDDARMGAQVMARGLAFTGADYDWRDDAMEVVLGGDAPGSAQCSHRVRHPVAISVQRGTDGHDRALRIEREEGQLLLLLSDRTR